MNQVSLQLDTRLIIFMYCCITFNWFLTASARFKWEFQRKDLRWYERNWAAWFGLGLISLLFAYRNYQFVFMHSASYRDSDSQLNVFCVFAAAFCSWWVNLPYFVHLLNFTGRFIKHIKKFFR